MPGIIPARNSLPIDVSVQSPYNTIKRLGGIMIAIAAADAKDPVDSVMSYL